MVKAVASIFTQFNLNYEQEIFCISLKTLSLGVDRKEFDFVIFTKNNTYLIETNYYNVVGSKLNEGARAFIELVPKINQYPHYEFVWITEGQGSSKAQLQKSYNLASLPNFVAHIAR